jgi:hypothetical protein
MKRQIAALLWERCGLSGICRFRVAAANTHGRRDLVLEVGLEADLGRIWLPALTRVLKSQRRLQEGSEARLQRLRRLGGRHAADVDSLNCDVRRDPPGSRLIWALRRSNLLSLRRSLGWETGLLDCHVGRRPPLRSLLDQGYSAAERDQQAAEQEQGDKPPWAAASASEHPAILDILNLHGSSLEHRAFWTAAVRARVPN